VSNPKEDAIEALRYIMDLELDDFCDELSDSSIDITEEESESLEDLNLDSEEFKRIIAKACSGGDMHIYARAYRGLAFLNEL
jgi:hypothetical protein